MTRTIFVLIILSVVLSAIAQLTLKGGMTTPAVQAELAVPPNVLTFIRIVTSWKVLLGLFVYFLSAAVWLLVLARTDVSLAYPFVGLGFVLTAFLGWLIRNEDLSIGRLSGTALIVIGVMLVARSGK